MPIKSAESFQALSILLPAAKPVIEHALDVIGTVHFARFVLLANNTQLAILTTYDGDFDRYIADFAQHIGGVFDQLFAHISDAPPLPVNKNVAVFGKSPGRQEESLATSAPASVVRESPRNYRCFGLEGDHRNGNGGRSRGGGVRRFFGFRSGGRGRSRIGGRVGAAFLGRVPERHPNSGTLTSGATEATAQGFFASKCGAKSRRSTSSSCHVSQSKAL